ncbi:MAG: iron ABC transporter permease [Alphaproteobacteria bacterium]
MTVLTADPGHAAPAARHRASRAYWRLIALALASGLSLPLLVIAAGLLQPFGDTWAHLAATVLPDYVRNTLLLVVGVGFSTLLIGTGTAWLVTMYRFPLHRIAEWALLLPLAVPAYLIAYTYADFLDFAGPVQTLLRDISPAVAGYFPPIRSLGGAIFLMSVVFYPYVYLLARASFLEQSVCVLEVGRTLGCGPWGNFFQVAVPLARPALAGGVALAVMEAVADFGTVQHLGVQTFTTGIFRTWFSFGDRVAAAQLSATLMAVIAMLMLIEFSLRGRARYAHTSGRYQPLPRPRLTALRGGLATAACVLPVSLGFVLPIAVLLWLAVANRFADAGGSFASLAWNTTILAGIGAVLVVAASALLTYAVRQAPGWVTRGGARIATLGYAAPGTVVAVGVLIPFAWLDNQLDSIMQQTFGVGTGLVLTGTIAAVLFAYLVRFAALGVKTVESGLSRIRPNMDDAARNLGLGALPTFVRVHAPLMRGTLLTAGLLVFVEILKELPATLIIRPFNFDTLAIRVFQLASDERLAEAATTALAIVGVGILPVILLSRRIGHGRPGTGEPGATAQSAGSGPRVY